jgi:hypothetical protein
MIDEEDAFDGDQNGEGENQTNGAGAGEDEEMMDGEGVSRLALGRFFRAD